MKKLLLPLLFANLLSAQHPDLLNTNWKIMKVESEVRPDYFPPTSAVTNLTTFSTNNLQLNSTFFNSVAGNLTYHGQDHFTVDNRSCTLADYMEDNGEVNTFFKFICDFYGRSGDIYYYIQNNGSEKTLVIHNSIFESIHFSAVNLATENVEKSQIILAPNPVKDFLTVENKNGLSSVKIYDLSGKLMFEQKNQNAKSLKINMQNFSAGIYIIKVNEENSFKIIKK